MKLFFLIPVYNHPKTLDQVVANCLKHNADVLLVDDGSNQETKKAIAKVVEKYTRVFAISLPENQGKGGAVLRGFRWGISQGYTHAFQLDADGQQASDDIAPFIKASAQAPLALINGYPIYNQSAPLARRWGRKVTNFWVCINTLSMSIKDALCGFRVYPLNAVQQLLKTQPYLGLRMDFDCDLLVQIAWQGTDIINLPVKIDYPSDGVSHFHAIENWRISKMHARLFFGMLRRLPVLLRKSR